MNILKITSIVLIIFIVAFFAINVPDEELMDGVKELASTDLIPPASEGPEEENAYFAILGFEGSERENIVDAGQRAHLAYYEAILEGLSGPVSSLDEIIGPALSFTMSPLLPQCFPHEQTACLPFYDKYQDKTTQFLGENRLILKRYYSLDQYSHYQDLMRLNPWNSWAKLSSAVNSAHALNVAEAARLFNEGEHQRGLDLLLSDIVLWRKILPGSADMDGKVHAFMALYRNYTLLAEMVALFPAGGKMLKNDKVLAPLTEREKSLDFVFDGYLQALYWDLSHHRMPFSQSEMSWLEKYFFKVNGTLNDAYELFDSLKRVSESEPEKLNTELSKLDEKIKNTRQKRISLIYNPLGKMFIATSFDSSVAADWNANINLLEGAITALRDQTRSTGR